MSRSEWIVCERTSRWASAMRLELAAEGSPIRLRETRSLSELTANLLEDSTGLSAVEVHRGNFADVLAWLTSARRRCDRGRLVALLDRSLASHATAARDALVEAGAEAIANSPRRLSTILAVGARHGQLALETDENVPYLAQVWASLPWQPR